MTGVHQRACMRIVVALCLAAMGLTVSAAASVEADKRTPKCFGKKATIVGTSKSEKLRGTSGDDVIVAKGGSDTIKAKGGDDRICAGPGNDVVRTSGGKDRVLGEAGNDKLYGEVGNDSLDGGLGNDHVDGGLDHDTLIGGDGDDRLLDLVGTNTFTAGTGNDAVQGGTGPDVVRAGSGNDSVDGGNGNDQLFGEAGVDTLEGGNDDDTLDGGSEADTLEGGNDDDTLTGGTGNDALTGGNDNDSLAGGDGNDELDGGPGLDLVDGGTGDDEVVGGTDQDELVGGDGNDTLTAGEGNDDLDGGPGKDDMTGGTGADELRGGAGTNVMRDDSPEPDTFNGALGLDICYGGPEDQVVDCDFDQDDKVVVAPHQEAPSEDYVDVAEDATIGMLDVYVLVDRSGSMSTEINGLKNGLSTALDNVRCPPVGSGTVGQCVDDLWAGAGTLGYAMSGAAAYANFADISPNANFTGLPTSEPSGCCSETTNFALWATITGQGGGPFGAASVPARTTCAGSPAANGGYPTYGYPCFRNGAIPVVALVTDEAPNSGDTLHTPAAATVTAAYNNRSARIVGLLGDGFAANTDVELESYATATGAVDARNGNAPIVLSGGGANAATAFENAIETLVAGTPLDVTAVLRDEPSDAVDAVAAFADHVETFSPGTASCADANDLDTNGDTFDDAYADVTPGTDLCWRVVAKTNTTVPQTDTPQLFWFDVDVLLDGISLVSTQRVYFLIPEA